MTDTAEIYCRTLDRLAAGESLASISTDDLVETAKGVAVDAEQRIGRLNRFADARQALERVGQMSREERKRIVPILVVREKRGHALNADAEATLALNAAAMLETIKADLQRRGASLN